MRLCEWKERNKKVEERMMACMLEKANETKQHDHFQMARDLEFMQGIQELLLPLLSRRPAAAPKKAGRSPVRHGQHWSVAQKKSLERRVVRLLTESDGLTVGGVCRKLNLYRTACAPVLGDMLSRGALRRVKVTVTFGRGAHRKMAGYALPLRAIAARAA